MQERVVILESLCSLLFNFHFAWPLALELGVARVGHIRERFEKNNLLIGLFKLPNQLVLNLVKLGETYACLSDDW